MPVANVKEPEISTILVPNPVRWKVGLLVTPDQFISRQLPLTFAVTVWLPEENELASKNTSSVVVGTAAPEDPPLDVDQCVVSFQFPPSPTQYLAIYDSK